MNFDFWTKNPGETPDDVPYINLIANSLTSNAVTTKEIKCDTINGQIPVFGGGGLTNPLTSTLDADGNDIIRVSNLTVDNISSTDGTAGIITVNGNVDMNLGAIFNAGTVNTSVFNAEQLYVTNKIEMELTGRINNTLSIQTDELRVSSILSNLPPLATTLTIATTQMKLDATTLNMANSPIINVNSLAGVGTNSISMLSNVDALSMNTALINNVKYIRSSGDMVSTTLVGIYVVCGIITLTQQYQTAGDCVFVGYGRENSGFVFNIPGVIPYCLTSDTHHITFINMRISNISPSASLFSFTDAGRTKRVNIFNSLFVTCKNAVIVSITGYELVDINQTIFEFCNPTNRHLFVGESDNIKISNCILQKSFDVIVPSNFGTAPLIELSGNCGLVNISGNIISTSNTQDGIKLSSAGPAFTSTSTFLGGNIFYSDGSTGLLLNYIEEPGIMVSDNAGVKNNRALLSATSSSNAIYTSTISGTYVDVNFGGSFTQLASNRFIPGVSPFSFTYNGRQPIDVIVNVNITADHNTGGNDIIQFALFKGATIVSFSQVTITANVAYSFGYNCITSLNFGDILQFRVQNLTVGTNTQGFRCVSFNGSLSEA